MTGIVDMDEEQYVKVVVGRTHLALVDRADLHLVAAVTWRTLRGHNGKTYAYRGSPSIYMHRLIAETPAGLETDHINGDGLDNRRANLRHATPSQNRANMGKPRLPDGRQPTSQFKGVSWSRERGLWLASIRIDGRGRNLGRFETPEEAASAYDRAALDAWGEFAFQNLGSAS